MRLECLGSRLLWTGVTASEAHGIRVVEEPSRGESDWSERAELCHVSVEDATISIACHDSCRSLGVCQERRYV